MKSPTVLVAALLLALPAARITAQEPAPDPAAVPAGERRITITGQDYVVTAGETLERIMVVGGDLRIEGQVTGDAIVVGGDLILEASGVVLGDAVVTGGELVNRGGQVRGEMRSIDGGAAGLADAASRSAAGAAAAVQESRAEARRARAEIDLGGRGDAARSGVRRIVGEIVAIVSTLALWLVLAGAGAMLVFYGRPYLEAVSDTVRSSTLRAAATGLAASFLVLPAFVIMVVALAVSIVGIPLLLVAIPGYPLAIFAAAVFGLLGVSHAIGERTADQGLDRYDLRYRNSYAYVFTGLTLLLMPHVAAHLISMTGFLRLIGMLLMVVSAGVVWAAATVGFGAVILSRGGTRRTFAAPIGSSLDEELFPEGAIPSDDNT